MVNHKDLTKVGLEMNCRILDGMNVGLVVWSGGVFENEAEELGDDIQSDNCQGCNCDPEISGGG